MSGKSQSLPSMPSRISRSVGYGRLGSPGCHDNGALTAFDALILKFRKKVNGLGPLGPHNAKLPATNGWFRQCVLSGEVIN